MEDKMQEIEEILKQMEKIEYGWVDRFGVVHRKIKKAYYLREYRLQPPEVTRRYQIGTCWDQAELLRETLMAAHVPVCTFLFDYDAPGVLAKHTIAVAKEGNRFIWMESSWRLQGEPIFFEKMENLFERVIALYPKMYKIADFDRKRLKIYEYDRPPWGVSFDEFCKFCKGGVMR